MATHTTLSLVNLIHEEPRPLELVHDAPLSPADEGRINRYLATCVAKGYPALKITTEARVTCYAFPHLKGAL